MLIFYRIAMGIADFKTKSNNGVFSTMERPRVIKMHLPYELLPKQFHQKQPKVSTMRFSLGGLVSVTFQNFPIFRSEH